MDPILGALVPAAFAVCAGAFAWLRSDIRRVEARLETRLDRLEDKVDGLILALARAGFLVDPQAQEPPTTDHPDP